eukprot:CAMPEP_0168460384 /NCGR_PEP_ID=MMETSP0228-20121227/53416_1 /TAXON_ID=133427 /ORGANISM="Protoceratium reticulatum, Strain CCCM 535 (=CCMP 1889)" /LENGTH=176 /DNA_ID=CAMNT_0008475615 /DNA_START=23 /DNA_END=550 /DNA_ORIENTATION=+
MTSMVSRSSQRSQRDAATETSRPSGAFSNAALSFGGLSAPQVSHEPTFVAGAVSRLTFRDQCVMRGTPMHEVLHAGGRIFGDTSGSDETWNLSRQVDQLDGFQLGHAAGAQVQGPGFALQRAEGDAAMAAACALGAWLTATGKSPYIELNGLEDRPRGLASVLLGTGAFWATLLCG